MFMLATPGLTDSLKLAMFDIDATRHELLAGRINVSETFHDKCGIFHHAGTEDRVIGLDPQRRSNASFARFNDPDGSAWFLQAIRQHVPQAGNRKEDHETIRRPEISKVDEGTTLMDTWRTMEKLVDCGKCKAIGLSDVSVDELREVFEQARIKPSVVQLESHPYLPQTEILEFCNSNGLVMLAFAPLGHGIKPGLLEDPTILAVAQQFNKTPAQVLLAWAVQRGTAVLTTPRTPDRAKENFDISALPADVMEQIDAIPARQRFNLVTGTGIPGFIAKGN